MTQLVAALALMFVYSWLLALVFLATVPLYVGLMRFSADAAAADVRQPRGGLRQVPVRQIDAIQRHRDGEGARRRRTRSGRLMLRAVPGRSPTASSAPSSSSCPTRARCSSSRSLSLGAVPLRRRARGRARATVARRVRRLQRAVALANAPMLLAALALGPSCSCARVLLDRLDDVLEQEPEQGADRSRLRAGDARSRDASSSRTSASATAARSRRRSSRGSRSTSSRARRSRSSAAAAPGKTTLIKLPGRAARADRGHDPLRRPRAAHARLPDAAPADRLRAAGELPVRRHDRRATSPSARSEPDPERVVWAAQAANAHEFVQRLPLGYDTRVGETGPAALRRAAAADRDRAGALPPPADPALRRGDERARHASPSGPSRRAWTSCSTTAPRS